MNKSIKNLINALSDLSNMNKENLVVLTSLQDNYIKKLSKRIDKAIEYIEKEEHSKWIMYGRDVLLDILKGSDKE